MQFLFIHFFSNDWTVSNNTIWIHFLQYANILGRVKLGKFKQTYAGHTD